MRSMLREFIKVRQDPLFYRRLFTDDYFDLFLWYNSRGGKIIGFQLCYDKDGSYRALTWEPERGFNHTKVDEGDSRPGKRKGSPILVADGIFNKDRIAYRFRVASRHMDRSLADMVYRKLKEYK